MRLLIIPLIAVLLSGCLVIPQQLDDSGQDRNGLFQHLVEDDVLIVDMIPKTTEVSQ
ncbi:MAG: starvation-inducible outer membrane lipoprotein [Arenicella sp.]|jgi:starvation-inducible outer membrane lipoprotein